MLNLWGAFLDFIMQLADIGIIHIVPPYNGIHTPTTILNKMPKNCHLNSNVTLSPTNFNLVIYCICKNVEINSWNNVGFNHSLILPMSDQLTDGSNQCLNVSMKTKKLKNANLTN
jgi:hypothetical protein